MGVESVVEEAVETFFPEEEQAGIKDYIGKIATKMGGLTLKRRSLEGRRVFTFDALPKCVGEGECLWHIRLGCGYQKDTDLACPLLRLYLTRVTESLYLKYKELSDDEDFDKVGTMFLPKYIEAMRVRIEARALGPTVTTGHGGIAANPLYKELDRMEDRIFKMQEYFDAKLKATEPTPQQNARFGGSNAHAKRLMG